MFIVDWFYSFLNWLGFANKKGKILFLGLDNAGKTTLLNMLKSDKLGAYVPTTHPNVEELTIGKLNFKTIDLGGHELARRLWKDFFTTDVSAVVFIIDTADNGRFQEAKRELDGLLSSEELQKAPFLILGNKIDKKGAVSEAQLVQTLGLGELMTGKNNTQKGDFRPLEVYMCSILNQMGYRDGFQWLSKFF